LLFPLHPPIADYKLKKVCKTQMLRKLKQRFGGKTIRDVRFRMIFLKLSLVALTCSTVGKSIKAQHLTCRSNHAQKFPSVDKTVDKGIHVRTT
jgi:hypothetical protein